MEEETLKSIDKKLNTMIKLLAGNCIQGKSKTEAIITLGALGIDTDTIAQLVDTTPGTVNTRLWERKKKSETGAKKTRKIKKSGELE